MNTRALAIDALGEIENGSYSNLTLNIVLNNIKDKRDRALITAIVYGVLRYRQRLDYIISQIANRPLEKIDKKVLIALRVAIYQIDYLERIPARAAVNETIKAVKNNINRGIVGFINGVLRNYIRNKNKIKWPDRDEKPVKFIASYYSHPEWMVKKWLSKYGYNDTVSLCKENNKIPDLIIRRNILKSTENEFISAFKNKNIEIYSSGIADSFIIKSYDSIGNLPLYDSGGFFVQGSAATLTGHVLNPIPDIRILDMTAAPGGKTTHLAELMNNRGEIIALDIYDHKIKLIKDNCKRLGINIVDTIKIDAAKFNSSVLFDKILLDAPCSGLGVLANKPELKWRIKPSDIDNLSSLQYNLLEKALTLLKPGGELVYSTCTLTDSENKQVINKFLDNYSNKVQILSLKEDLKRLGVEHLYPDCNTEYIELFPPQSGTEGFFMAKFRRI